MWSHDDARKAAKLGPLRINLLKSRLEAFRGVAGAPLGVDAPGKLHAAGGRDSLPFRKAVKLGPLRINLLKGFHGR